MSKHKMKRFSTSYQGVYYIKGTSNTTGKEEKIYYIRYRKNNKSVEEKAGRQFQDNMTPAKANVIRSGRIQGRELSNTERREADRAEKIAQAGKMTIGKLWEKYKESKGDHYASKKDDVSRYNNYIEKEFAAKEPSELISLDFERLKKKISQNRSPQTVKHVLILFGKILKYGSDHALCPPLPFKIKMPKVDNIKTEDLTLNQQKKYLEAIDNDINQDVADIVRLAFYTGIRRGEIFKLQKQDIDFERGFIFIRKPKGGKSVYIPMNNEARKVLEKHITGEMKETDFIFPGKNGGQRVTAQKAIRRIRDAAGLSKNFRPLHGLRHVYASNLASSTNVDMYVLQKMLTHKDPRMTQRYAHLRDEALRNAAGVADSLIADLKKPAKKEETG